MDASRDIGASRPSTSSFYKLQKTSAMGTDHLEGRGADNKRVDREMRGIWNLGVRLVNNHIRLSVRVSSEVSTSVPATCFLLFTLVTTTNAVYILTPYSGFQPFFSFRHCRETRA
jgi:hypothetical protein